MSVFPITRGAAVGVAASLVLALGATALGYRAYDTGSAAGRFDKAVCTLASRQAHNSASFVELLTTLEQRATARERIDERAGDATAVASDADSARLYAFVLAGYRQKPAGRLPC